MIQIIDCRLKKSEVSKWIARKSAGANAFEHKAGKLVKAVSLAILKFFKTRFMSQPTEGETNKKVVKQYLDVAWFLDPKIFKGKADAPVHEIDELKSYIVYIANRMKDMENPRAKYISSENEADRSDEDKPNTVVEASAEEEGIIGFAYALPEVNPKGAPLVTVLEQNFEQIIRGEVDLFMESLKNNLKNERKKLDRKKRRGDLKAQAKQGQGEIPDPLDWWGSEEAARFPELKKVARFVYCIPATSVASERCFSATGNIASARRSRLAPKRMKELVYIKANLVDAKNDFMMSQKQ